MSDPLHPRDARAVDGLVADCRQLFGPRLLAVALYGEAATAAYRPLVSPLDTVVVLDHVTAADLPRLRAHVNGWYRRRLTTPLVIDPTHLDTSCDVFPLELLELHDRHRLLHGATDPLAALPPPALPHLRLELEEQLKGKLLHLRESYLALGRSGRGLDALLRAVVATLDVLLRGLLAAAGRPRPVQVADVVRDVEATLGVPLPAIGRLERWRRGEERLAPRDLEAAVGTVHDELAALAGRVDRR